MEATNNRVSHLASIAIGLGLIGVVAIALLYFLLESAAIGLAELPNGSCAVIYGQFSCAENPGITTVKAGGHVFVFSPTNVTVDNSIVATLDSSVESIEIEAKMWTASLRINGTEVPITR